MPTTQMNPHSDPAYPQAPVAERRRHPRVAGPFRARVRGMSARGEEFTEEAELKDLSGCGLYVRLAERVEPGAQITAEVFIAEGGARGLTVEGKVVRAEALIDGRCGAGVELTGYQVI